MKIRSTNKIFKQYSLRDYVNVRLEKSKNKTTYSQDWPAYNLTQTNECGLFQDILIELIDCLIETKTPVRRGRPFRSFREMLFCCALRAYFGKSSRRSVSFLDYAKASGYITKKPHFNTILNYYKDKTLTPILKYLMEKSGSPLRGVEVDFTIDASGFSTSLFGRWLDVRLEPRKGRRIFKKVHVTSGVKTNIITAIEVTPGYFADSPQFKDLIQITSKTFQMREVSADKAYSSRENLKIVTQLEAIPYIPFKKSATKRARGHMVWSRMKKYFDEHKEEFMQHYHKRSNAESVFSMMKRKFDQHLYSKTETGQINEILCKALAHNICVLIQEMFELGINVDFNYCAKMQVTR